MKTEAAIALLGTMLLSTACSHKDDPLTDEARPVRSAVATAGGGAVGATYSGQVHARYESKLGFQVAGKVVTRHVELGSHVRRGQSLLRLDPAQETLQVVAAVANVDAAANRVAQNRVDLQRSEKLLARQFASQSEVDQQRLALGESESQLRSAVAQHQAKVNQRAYTELVADRDGVVTAVNAEAGQVVSAGQPIVTVAADGEREVLVSIPESRVEELRKAGNLYVSLWARPDKRYAGSLREVAPDADNVTRTYSARVSVIDADSALSLGMTASVHAPDVEGARAIRLPLSAIYNKDGQPLVWVIDTSTSRVTTRGVELGTPQGDAVLVTKGLVGGETVVTAGVHMLHAGQRVKVVAPTSAAQGRQP